MLTLPVKLQYRILLMKPSLRQALKASTILTNATSLGMAPHADTCPIPDASMLRPKLIVSDIIYNPKQTRLLPDGFRKWLCHL